MSVHKPTSEQLAAARPLASAWVSANAGSGKTRVLTDRVARLLLAGADPSRILCLTYTRAAAAEMERRLFDTLGAWSMQDDAGLAASLAAIEDEPMAQARLPEARRLFARALEAPGGLKIETIHAFCQRVLQRFPVEAGVPPDFEVLDDNEAGALAELAKRSLLRRLRAGAGDAIEGAFERLYEARGEFTLDTIIDDGLKRRREIEAFLDRHGADLSAAVRARLGLRPDESFASVRARGHCDPECDEAALRRAVRALETGGKRDKERARAIARYLDAGDRESAADAYRAVFLKKDGEPFQDIISKSVRQFDGGIENVLRREQARLARLAEREKAAETADLTIAALTLLGEILADYRARKTAQRALDYEDLIGAMGRLLSDVRAQWVQFKLDGGIDHLLVDEAQDTSPEQWSIIRKLTEEFFAHEAAGEPRLRTVFAVGDEKQSIYSFQGADPKMFAAMRAHFESAARNAGRDWTKALLETSFRSTGEILAVVDRLCRPASVLNALTGADRPIHHKAERKDDRGLVELWPVIERDRAVDLEAHKDWTRPVDAPKSTAERELGDRIARQIRAWLEAASPLYEGGPPIGCGDVLILVRRRDALFFEAIRALHRAGLAVAGADRMILGEEAAFLDLEALARFCLLPEDDLALAEVLKGPFIGLDDADLVRLCPRREVSLWRTLKNAPEFAAAAAFLEARIRDARALRPFEFFTRALDGPDHKRMEFAARLGGIAHDVIGEVLSLALAYEREGAASLQGFLKYAAAHGQAIKRDMEEVKDSVRVMTVHGAKGLEAPIVFLIDTCRETRAPRENWMFADETPILRLPANERDAVAAGVVAAEQRADEEESLRELYVAMTRAKDRLYVAGAAGPRDVDARGAVRPDRWHALVETALKELPRTEHIAGAGGTVLRYGSEPKGPAKSRRSDTTWAVPPLPAWALAPPRAELETLRRTPSGLLAGEEAVLAANPPAAASEAALRGRLTHRLLEELPKLPADERDAAARRLAQSSRYRDLAPFTEEILVEVFRILGDRVFAAAFGAGSRAEVRLAGGFAVSGRRVIVSGQIDRLVVEPQRVLIVDYKTNRGVPKPLPRAYLAQMAAYRALLKEILPGRRIDAALLFTSVPRLVPLDSRELDVIAVTALGEAAAGPAADEPGTAPGVP